MENSMLKSMMNLDMIITEIAKTGFYTESGLKNMANEFIEKAFHVEDDDEIDSEIYSEIDDDYKIPEFCELCQQEVPSLHELDSCCKKTICLICYNKVNKCPYCRAELNNGVIVPPMPDNLGAGDNDDDDEEDEPDGTLTMDYLVHRVNDLATELIAQERIRLPQGRSSLYEIKEGNNFIRDRTGKKILQIFLDHLSGSQIGQMVHLKFFKSLPYGYQWFAFEGNSRPVMNDFCPVIIGMMKKYGTY